MLHTRHALGGLDRRAAHVLQGPSKPPAFNGRLPSRRAADVVVAARRTKTQTKGFDSNAGAEEKAAALKGIVDKLNDRFGKGSLFTWGGALDQGVPMMTSGCLALDHALGGGYPKGRVVEIYGPESSGKTTLALHAMAEFQKAGGKACFVDAEHALDVTYAKAVGVDMTQLMICQPDCGEMALEVVDELCRSHAVNVIVIDSVSALVPRAELEGEIGQTQVGSQARLMSSGLRKLCSSANKSGTCLIFINQIRFKIGVMYGNPETTSGGNALKFYSSVRIDVRKKDKLENSEGGVIGFKTKAKIIKNKCAAPYKEAMFDIVFGAGIDSISGLVDSAVATGALEKRGSWFWFEGERINHNGRDKLMVYLRSDPEFCKRVTDAVNKTLHADPLSMGAGDEDEGGTGDDEGGEEFEEEP